MDSGVQERAAAPSTDFDLWVEARFVALMRFAYLVTGSQQAAEDALQTALERALSRWERVSRTREPDGYVRRMVVNAHIDAWRRTGSRESPVAAIRTAASDPAATTAERDALWNGCRRLPPQQRAAVVLRFYEDLDYPEIAAVLGVAEPTARSHVHRALTTLRAELGQEEEDG